MGLTVKKSLRNDFLTLVPHAHGAYDFADVGEFQSGLDSTRPWGLHVKKSTRVDFSTLIPHAQLAYA